MPQTRHYSSNAQRQAAYRERLAAPVPKGGPVARIPSGNKPGRALGRQAEHALTAALQEMRAYHESRSERWRDSEKAEEFEERLESLEEIQELLRDWLALDSPLPNPRAHGGGIP